MVQCVHLELNVWQNLMEVAKIFIDLTDESFGEDLKTRNEFHDSKKEMLFETFENIFIN